MDLLKHLGLLCILCFTPLIWAATSATPLAQQTNDLPALPSLLVTPIDHPILNDLLVRHIYIDQQKVAWIGTDSGMYRYSNGQVEQLGHQYAGNTLVNNGPVTAIQPLGDEHLVISYFPDSVAFFNLRLDRFVPPPFAQPAPSINLSASRIQHLLPDKWLIWAKQQLLVYTPSTQRLDSLLSLSESNNGVHATVLSEDGTLWLSSNHWLHKSAPPYQSTQKVLPINFVLGERNLLLMDSQQQLHLVKANGHYQLSEQGWQLQRNLDVCPPGTTSKKGFTLHPYPIFSTNAAGVRIVSNCGLYQYHLATQQLKAVVLPAANAGANWLTSYNGYYQYPHMANTQSGLFFMQGNKVTRLLTRAAPSNGGSSMAIGPINPHQYLVADGSPGLKLASPFNHRLHQLDQAELQQLTGGHALRDILLQDQHNLWLASQVNGLFHLTRHPRQQASWQLAKHYFADAHIRDLWQDGHTLWVATEGAGLQQIDLSNGTRKQLLSPAAMLAQFKITALDNKRVLVGYSRGVMIFDRQSGALLHKIDQPPASAGKDHFVHVWAVAADKQGNIWFGSHDTQTNLFKLSADLQFEQSLRLGGEASNYAIMDLTLDKQQQPVVATWGGGLFYRPFGQQQFSRLTMADGLPSDTILSVFRLDNDYWLSTDKGLARVSLCQQPGCQHQVKTLSKADGLATNLFDLNGASLNHDGSLSYAGFYGANWFHPGRDLEYNPYVPQQHHWTSVRVDEQNAWPQLAEENDQPHLRLPHSTNNLALRFTSDDHQYPDKKAYRYRVNQGDWIPTRQPLIELAYLAAGHYQIDATSSNSEGLWSNAQVSLNLHITPPWWRTNGAYAGYALAMVALWLALFKWRQRRILAQNRRLEHTVAQRTREVQTSNQALQQSMRDKEQMFQNTSHELRTPLQAIMSLSQLVTPEVKSPQGQHNLSLIAKESKYLLRQIENTLDKAEVAIHDQQRETLNIHQYFAELVATHGVLASDKQQTINLTCEINPATRFTLTKDAARHIFGNLLGNAIKYSPKASVIDICLTEQQGQLEVSIIDQGPGIEDISTLQQRAVRGTDEQSGHGIGLDIVKGALSLNQGSIRFSNMQPKGLQVSVHLPCTLPSSHDAQQQQPLPLVAEQSMDWPSNPFANKKRILLVEDHPILLDTYSQFFASVFSISTCQNGKQAQQYLQNDSHLTPDLIISDVMMPEMDGLTLCEWVKTHADFSAIPLVLLTAKGDQASKLTGFNKGADLYVTKPITHYPLFIKQVLNLLKTVDARDQLIKQFASGTSEQTTEALPVLPEFTQQLFEHIEQHYANPRFKVEKLRELMAMNESQLRREIKKHALDNPKSLLDKYRLQKAEWLLHNTDLKVKDIAEQCGYTTSEDMRKKFKAAHGLSPSEVRQGLMEQEP